MSNAMNGTLTAERFDPASSLVPAVTRQALLRRRLSAATFDRVVSLASKMSYKHPGADPSLYGVRVVRDLRYGDAGVPEHKLDVYMPERPPAGRLPVVLYVHGGAFRLLSKASHWMMAVAFARRGYVVFNIDYRLAPKHVFPSALEDVNRAWLWVLDHADQFGGDLERIVVAGESAGANLVTSLAIETSYRRDEPFAHAVFDRGVRPHAVMAACGIFQVSGVERLFAQASMPTILTDWLTDMQDAYLGGAFTTTPAHLELADPLLILERGEQPERPLPAFFLPVGGGDILVDDTLRMKSALERLGVPNDAKTYGSEPHAFHMLTWRSATRRLWSDTFRFLRDHLPVSSHAGGTVEPMPVRSGSWIRDRIITAMAA